jgi:hypothetical protein
MENIKLIIENITLVYVLLGVMGLITVILIFKPGKKLILAPELIPYSMHYKNVRAVLSGEEWRNLAKLKYKEANYRCEICGVKGRVECHEVWHFNDRKLVQSLVGLVTLCSDCHKVKHIGLARKMGWFGDSLYHMSKVNGISIGKAKKYIEYAEIEVKKRREEYDLDLTYLNNYRNVLSRKFSTRENDNCVRIQGNY